MPTVPWRTTLEPDDRAGCLVMASRLPLRSAARVPWFVGLTVSVVRQLERTDGLIGYSLRAQPFAKTFWTLSAWTDEQSLAAFVRELPHRSVMARLRPQMGPTLFTTWTVPATSLPPSWDDAIERLMNEACSPRRPR